MTPFCLTCVERHIPATSANPNLDKVSPFVCNTCFNLIIKQEARKIPLLPFWNVSGQINDLELFHKSDNKSRYVDVMFKDILGAVKPPQGEVSNDKMKGRINKDDEESNGGDDVVDPSV